jgi:hypothetical protein
MLWAVEKSDSSLPSDRVEFSSFFDFCDGRLTRVKFFEGTYNTMIDMWFQYYIFILLLMCTKKNQREAVA